MFQSLFHLVARPFTAARKPARLRRSGSRPIRAAETLEVRQMPAATMTAVLSGGVLKIEGTNGNDRIVVRENNGFAGTYLTIDNCKISVNGSQKSSVGIGAVDKIEVRALGGNDYVSLQASDYEAISVNATIWGGSGNDRLVSGAGDDRVYGDAGEDEVFGQAGNDIVSGGSGSDRHYGGFGQDTAYLSQAREMVAGTIESVHITLPGGSPQSRNTCGPNSAWRVIQAHGGTASLQSIIDSASESSIISRWNLGTTGQTLVGAMNSNARGLGSYRFGLSTNRSLDEVIAKVREGKPVVTMISTSGSEKFKIGLISYTVPRLHWVAVDGYDAKTNKVFYTDTNGIRYEMNYGDFNSNFRWDFGWTQNKFLQSQGVVSGTFIS